MVSLRMWIDFEIIITLRHRRIMAVDDLRIVVSAGNGPTSPGDFLENISDRLVLRMGNIVSDIDDSVDSLEDEISTAQSNELRKQISNIRRATVMMRRYLAPQRDVMARLYNEKVEWLSELDRMRLREIADRTTRYVEDLDAIRDRTTLTHEELNNRQSEQMNKTMYVLPIISGTFLPLGILTGLFGINIGGMPGTENPWAFSIFCFALMVVVIGQIFYFKKMRWL